MVMIGFWILLIDNYDLLNDPLKSLFILSSILERSGLSIFKFLFLNFFLGSNSKSNYSFWFCIDRISSFYYMIEMKLSFERSSCIPPATGIWSILEEGLNFYSLSMWMSSMLSMFSVTVALGVSGSRGVIYS